MTTRVYPALVEGDGQSGYRASFPDFADATAEGHDLSDLLRQARETVTARLEALSEGDKDWPTPTAIEVLRGRPGALLMVDVAVEDAPQRVNLSIGEQLLKRIDLAAAARGMTRSGFVSQACRVALGEEPARKATDFEAAARRLQDELSVLGRKISESVGPDGVFSRRMADLDERIYDSIQKTADKVSEAMAKRRRAGSDKAAA